MIKDRIVTSQLCTIRLVVPSMYKYTTQSVAALVHNEGRYADNVCF